MPLCDFLCNFELMAENTKDILPLQWIKGVGPKKAEALAKEGIVNPVDILMYFPRAYIDRNAVSSLKALAVKLRQENSSLKDPSSKFFSMQTEVTVVANIASKKEIQFGKKKKMLRVGLQDISGGFAEMIFWSYAAYYDRTLKIGELVTVSGKVELDKYGKVSFTHPEIDKFNDDDAKAYAEGKILPVYKLTEGMRNVGINVRSLRYIVENVIDKELGNIKETLSDELLMKFKLPGIRDAVRQLHFPTSKKNIERCRQRMKFQEIFFFEMFLAVRQQGVKIKEKGLLIEPKSRRARELVDALPFELTGDQKKVIREVARDFQSGSPMNRLLQGDVGSGKTIVAVLSMLMAVDEGFQTAFMAPTELLAEQHYRNLTKYMSKLGVKVIQLVGGQKKKARREILEQIASGEGQIIVGTHALFESEIEYNKLGLVIIDEQHRFGVAQRAELKKLGERSHEDNNISPHILVMSATPIPRTLSMTVYGDLDVSIIKEMPKNRKPIKTKVAFESQLHEVYEFIRDEIKKGHQAYIVYPLVEDSEKLDLKSAVTHYDFLNNEIFPELKCGLLHGQMFWYEKEDAMQAFLNKEYHILVATTVIEVGIDIPNATVMLIENAERFGLSQLHQLRGRVGRGADQSFCILATKDNFRYEMRKKGSREDDSKANIIRLKTMERTSDGFEIAKVDLDLRGPGDFLGTKQSGLPNFKFIDLVNDGRIIDAARKEAFNIIKNDPHLRNAVNIRIRNEFLKQYENGMNFFDVA